MTQFIYYQKLANTLTGGSSIPGRRGRQPWGRAPTYYFAKFSEKLHEIENILGRRHPPLALILKLKENENMSAFFPIDILLMIMESSTFVWHLVRMPIRIRPVDMQLFMLVWRFILR